MPYQIKAGSLTLVVPTVQEALKTFDAFRFTDTDEAIIRDMDGTTLDVDLLRQVVRLAGED